MKMNLSTKPARQPRSAASQVEDLRYGMLKTCATTSTPSGDVAPTGGRLYRRLATGSLFLATLLATSTFAAQQPPSIIPQPQKVELKDGVFVLSPNTQIHADQAATATGAKLAALLRRATGEAFPLDDQASATSGIVLTSKGADASLGPEGYTLSVTKDGAFISATSDAGLFYGAVTLVQLFPPEIFSSKTASGVAWQAPCVKITDSPRFQWRGLLVDVSRHFLSVDDLKKFMDVMALHKLNTLHLHLTDDQGWRLEIKKYPRLTELGSVRKESPKPGARNQGDGKPYGPFFYSQAQIRDLVAYGQSRHITIMPEIEMPGHLLGVLTAYPQYACTPGPFEVRTRWGVEKDVLCIGNTNSISFMEDVLTEVLDLFPSKFIHIGGDEVPRDRWKECAKCQALMKAEGLTREAQLQTWFNHHIETFLASKGRRMIGWDEILEGGLTPGAAVMSWRGVKGGIEAAEAGHDVVMSPNSHLYLDYGQARGPGEPEVIGGFLPLDKVYGYEPMPTDLPADKRKHILGAQGNLWSEYLPTLSRFEYNAYPRASALAELAWSPTEARNFDDFSHRLSEHLKRLAVLNVNYRRETSVKVGEWAPGQIKVEATPVEWDITKNVKAAGKFNVSLEFIKGKHGADIAWVALLEDGKEISRDAHAGFAGGNARNTTYALDVPAPKAGARYALRAQLSGNGGTDSAGAVYWSLKPVTEK
jgi:hexosaminidase